MNDFRSTYQQIVNEDWKDNLNPLDWQRDTQHMALGLTGMIPIVGVAADITNAIMYYNDNDKLGYWMSVISMIPAGDIVKLIMPFRQTTGVITNPGAVRVILYFLKKGKEPLNFALRNLMKGLLKVPKTRNLIIKQWPQFINKGAINNIAIKTWADSISDGFLKWCNSKIETPVQPPKVKGKRRKLVPVRKPNIVSRKIGDLATGFEKIANPRMMTSNLGRAAEAGTRIGLAKYGKWAQDQDIEAAAAALRAAEQKKNDPNIFSTLPQDDY